MVLRLLCCNATPLAHRCRGPARDPDPAIAGFRRAGDWGSRITGTLINGTRTGSWLPVEHQAGPIPPPATRQVALVAVDLAWELY